MTRYTTKNPTETKKLASKILAVLPKGSIICLYGQLGAGKTTFTKGLAEVLELREEAIKSPTFSYIREYHHNDGGVSFHCDLYRLEKHTDAAHEMISELHTRDPHYIIIEWAEHLGPNKPKIRTDIHLKRKNGTHEITVTHIK
jgi:tRNA threonylcarbamoyladenosine biosynthesis protein TsaE